MIEADPYAPPVSDSLPTSGHFGEDELREQHIAHEALLGAIGILYYLVAASLIFFAPACLEDERLVPGILIGLGLLFAITGAGLRQFYPWARNVGVLAALVVALGIPIGPIISLMIVWVLSCRKTSFVFSPTYRRIIGLTPHVKPSRWRKAAFVIAGIVLAWVGIVTRFD